MRSAVLATIVAWVGCSAAGQCAGPATGPADLILVNGRIWTVDRTRPEAQALAIWRDRILAVGTDDEMRALAGPKTQIIDARNRRVTPGFYDSHVHLLSSGQRLSQVALKDAADEAEFGKRLVEFDRKLSRDRWLIGGEWDHDRAFGGQLPTAELIDKYVSDRPVFLRRYDGHMGVANSRALKMAGITAATADPSGGVIYRKPNSKEPSGLLRDNAMDLLDRLIPEPSEEEIIEAVKAALAECRQCGVTSVQDMDGSDAATRRRLFRLYQQLARSGRMMLRIDFRWPIALWNEVARLGVGADFGNEYVRIGGVKGFMDGSIGSSTAKMFSPFVNEPNSTGVWVTSREKMQEWVTGADKAGLSVAIHAIGDQANAVLLDIFQEAERQNGPRDRRFRIEHAQHLRPVDYPRFARLGVIASMQPYHTIDDGRWVEGRIGKERCASSYALRSLLDARAPLAFGSDWSVAPIDALLGIDAAVNRRTLNGKHPEGWFPEQKITVAEAIEGYTMGSAFAGFQEMDRGSLLPGKLADLVVLSRDILEPAERDHIADTSVVMTIVGGKVVYEKRD
jgi:predicted amidohydrolase YtcJ